MLSVNTNWLINWLGVSWPTLCRNLLSRLDGHGLWLNSLLLDVLSQSACGIFRNGLSGSQTTLSGGMCVYAVIRWWHLQERSLWQSHEQSVGSYYVFLPHLYTTSSGAVSLVIRWTVSFHCHLYKVIPNILFIWLPEILLVKMSHTRWQNRTFG